MSGPIFYAVVFCCDLYFMMSITKERRNTYDCYFKREIRNYLKRPLFWVGVLFVIYGVFNATSPYLTTHYLTTGEEIINDQSNTSVEGEVYEGYIPATPEKHREVWMKR